MKYIDTNIFLRYFMPTDHVKHARTSQLFDRIIDGQEEVMTSAVVIHETCYVLSASGINFYNLPHEEIKDRLYPLIDLEGMKVKDKAVCLAALDIVALGEKIDFADALAAAYVRSW